MRCARQATPCSARKSRMLSPSEPSGAEMVTRPSRRERPQPAGRRRRHRRRPATGAPGRRRSANGWNRAWRTRPRTIAGRRGCVAAPERLTARRCAESGRSPDRAEVLRCRDAGAAAVFVEAPAVVRAGERGPVAVQTGQPTLGGDCLPGVDGCEYSIVATTEVGSTRRAPLSVTTSGPDSGWCWSRFIQ